MSQTASATLGTKKAQTPLAEVAVPYGVDALVEYRFVYAEDDADSGASAGDAFDVSGYTWAAAGRTTENDPSPLFEYAEGAEVDVTQAASGVVTVRYDASDLTAGVAVRGAGEDVAGPLSDLRGTRPGAVLYGPSLRFRLQKFVTREGWPAGQAQTYAVAASVGGAGGVTVAVTVGSGGGGIAEETHTAQKALSATRDFALSDVGRRVKLDGYDLTLPASFAPSRSIYVYNPVGAASDRTVALPGGALTVAPGEFFEVVWEDADTAYAIPHNAIPFTA